jgi:trehalose 6-phosphate synthase
MRRRIHEDMCANDIVGLQTRADVQNFLHCAEVILEGASVDYDSCTVRFRGRVVHIRAYPISIDSAGLLDFKESPAVQAYIQKLRPLAGEKTIVRVDRSEPSKNIIRGLRSWELLLERYPDLRGSRSVSFTRTTTPRPSPA